MRLPNEQMGLRIETAQTEISRLSREKAARLRQALIPLKSILKQRIVEHPELREWLEGEDAKLLASRGQMNRASSGAQEGEMNRLNRTTAFTAEEKLFLLDQQEKLTNHALEEVKSYIDLLQETAERFKAKIAETK